ncbi:MAG: hypothetical protein M3277_04555 [Actinomycetota bacterium]|nr:hypothetical protein [Actinomycetota bacterium]
MKKLIAIPVFALLVLSIAGSASAGKKGAHQHVEGTIAALQGPAGAGCVWRTQRALYIAFGDAINGIVGYTFQVDPKTANKKFTLEVTDTGAGVDIQFYAELGDDPTAEAPANVGFETPGPGGEKGTVPEGYPNAFVCLTDGANASFVYKAGAGVK